MRYDPAAPKHDVNMTLNDDLVQRARRHTANLSETVEALLADYVAQAEGREIGLNQQIADYIKVSDDFAAEHGSLSDEFPTV